MEMFHVNGGIGEISYVQNSLLQNKVISMTWPIAEEAITELCSHNNFPTTLTMADLGCSIGPNTLMVVSNFIKQVEVIRRKLHKNALAYQIFFNDLHGNDFNAIFRSLPSFLENLENQVGANFGQCFFNGVPGSFYARLFPNNSVHFFYSSYTLHWLSQVPEGIENNKGNIFMSSTSPKSVLEAYYMQFQKDFSMFLNCRAKELVIGGHMVLTMIGRISEDSFNKECSYVWEFLTLALNSMVVEKIVEEEKVNSFNIPNYFPSPSEVKAEVLNEGSFTIDRFEVSTTDWSFYNSSTESNPSSMSIDDYIATGVRSVVEPFLVRHFGEAILEELFYRYKKIIADHISREKIGYTNLTISLTKIK